MAKRCFNSLIRLTVWTARLFWNGTWIFLAGCMGGTGLMFLFGLGVLAVLMVQGYPVAGVTLGCLGATVSLFSAAGLAMTLRWKKKKKGPGAVSQWENGEARETEAEHESGCRKEGGQYA